MDLWLSSMSGALLSVIVPLIVISTTLIVTRLLTTWNYYRSLHQFKDPSHANRKVVRPPQIPYTIPWLGNTLSFLSTDAGKFWDQLFSWHPRSTGVCTLLIGGRHTHIVYSATTVQALFRAKTPSRDVFEYDLHQEIFQMPPGQIHNALSDKRTEMEMNTKYLTNSERVNELTDRFTKVLKAVLDRDAEDVVKLDEMGLYHWLRDRMFTASCDALFGEKLLQMYPTYCDDFFEFDKDFLKFLFRFPSAMMKDEIQRRQRIFDNLEAWSLKVHELCGGTPVDPEGPAWEPYFGSRLNRARQLAYKTRKLTTSSGAALDAGMTFAISSNAIPATGWMLFHVLNPQASPKLLPEVLAEVRMAEKSDGSLDIATLVSQPLLQSIWTETLRLYSDVMVTRNLPEDITLPLTDDGACEVAFRKGDNIFAPSWLGHHDTVAWAGGSSPVSQFDAERFLVKDPKTGEKTFSINKTAGKFFPFGGGKTICPGRTFAKQEAIGALSMILLRFDFNVKGCVDLGGNVTQEFPVFSKAFPGSGALVPGGDMLVKMKRRTV